MPSLSPKVSVLTITYNHERFIEAAVTSALSQQTDFDFEIVVGEDCSTDRTRDILLDLQQGFPDKLRLLLNSHNVGLMRNFLQTLKACRGRYVALLEGDDYWTDPTKLQQQADFLDSHPDCVLCHHNVLKVVDGEPGEPQTWHPRKLPSGWQSVDDMLRTNIIMTCSSMFRAELASNLPDWFEQGQAPDWLLNVLIAKQGRVYYSQAVMGAYRLHAQSAWSSTPRIKQLERIVQHAELVKGALTATQRARLTRSQIGWHEEIVELLIREDKFDQARQHAARNLPDLRGYERLRAYFQGLEFEREGRRWRANRSLMKSLCTGWGATRVGAFDVLLALTRNNAPRLYAWSRSWYRRLHSDHASE